MQRLFQPVYVSFRQLVILAVGAQEGKTKRPPGLLFSHLRRNFDVTTSEAA